MERSLPNALLKSRAPGAMVSTGSDHWTASAMVFGERLYSNAPSSTSSTSTSNSRQDEGGPINGQAMDALQARVQFTC